MPDLESDRPAPESGTSARWEAETLRLYHRYEQEIVHGFGLCPWAPQVRRDGRVREHVLLQQTPTVRPSLDAIDTLDAKADLVLLIYPRLRLDRRDFDQFAARVRDAEVGRRTLGGAPFVFAVFHPDATPLIGDPERLIPFLRRTPDPTLQLLRASVLDHVRGSASQGTQFVDMASVFALAPPQISLRERVARTNLETTLRVGVDQVEQRLDDIRRDREETHRLLLLDRGSGPAESAE
jgi:hypothetical protein